jgi:cytochrome P450
MLSSIIGLLWPLIIYSLWTLLILVSAYVLVLAILEISYLVALKKFSGHENVAQGKYYPMIGFAKYYMPTPEGNSMRPLHEELRQNSASDLICYNLMSAPFGKLFVIPISKEAIKEYVAKEMTHSRRTSGDYPGLKMGFTGENGRAGLQHRQIFTEFFIYDRIQQFKVPMYKIAQDKFKIFIDHNKISAEKFTEVDMRKMIREVMLAWLSLVVFGCKDESELDVDLTAQDCAGIRDQCFVTHDLKGVKKISLAFLVEILVASSMYTMQDPMNSMLFGIPSKLGLGKMWKNHYALRDVVDAKIMEFWFKKKAEFDSNQSQQNEPRNIIDCIINHNKKCGAMGTEKDMLQPKEIIGDVIAFLFNGFETSASTSTTSLCYLTEKYPEWVQKIRKEGLGSLDEIFGNQTMQTCVSEITRMWGPVTHTFLREVTTEFTITGVKIPIGTQLMCPTNLGSRQGHWADADEFKPERWEGDEFGGVDRA